MSVSLCYADPKYTGLYARYPVSNIDFSSYTHINYAFAILTSGATPIWTDPQYVSTQLPQLVNLAHAANAKVLISVGGWSGCLTFSSMAADPAQRATFIQWSVNQIATYGVDGIDLDWEYPGRQGAGCNIVDAANDVDNYLVLIQELRDAFSRLNGTQKEISIAAHVRPMASAKDSQIISKFAAVLDRFNLMTYDINGAWNDTTGPNAPFNFQPGFGDADSYVSAIQSWTDAGAPAAKLVPGIAFYGRSATAKEDMTISRSQYQPQVAGQAPSGDSLDAYWQDPYCAKDPGGLSGIWRYGNLRSQGVLTTPTEAAAPWVRFWDNVTQTPWLFRTTDRTFISYDDPTSVEIKINYAICKGLGGAMVWSIDQDSTNNELLNKVVAIKRLSFKLIGGQDR
ncbi:glycoside hydrolase superfamily [Dichotomocladium elegans]|nr:glycoside hydrolase superfamily [Dichotomocladium elegans]